MARLLVLSVVATLVGALAGGSQGQAAVPLRPVTLDHLFGSQAGDDVVQVRGRGGGFGGGSGGGGSFRGGGGGNWGSGGARRPPTDYGRGGYVRPSPMPSLRPPANSNIQPGRPSPGPNPALTPPNMRPRQFGIPGGPGSRTPPISLVRPTSGAHTRGASLLRPGGGLDQRGLLTGSFRLATGSRSALGGEASRRGSAGRAPASLASVFNRETGLSQRRQGAGLSRVFDRAAVGGGIAVAGAAVVTGATSAKATSHAANDNKSNLRRNSLTMQFEAARWRPSKQSPHRIQTRPEATDPALRNTIDALFRTKPTAGNRAQIGSGSTADAIRYERETGRRFQTADKIIDHRDKARNRSKSLENWLRRNPNAAPGDRRVARDLLRDLEDACGGPC
jgi:hypothetical protein